MESLHILITVQYKAVFCINYRAVSGTIAVMYSSTYYKLKIKRFKYWDKTGLGKQCRTGSDKDCSVKQSDQGLHCHSFCNFYAYMYYCVVKTEFTAIILGVPIFIIFVVCNAVSCCLGYNGSVDLDFYLIFQI